MSARLPRRTAWHCCVSLALTALAAAVPATARGQAEVRVTALSSPSVRNGVVGTAAQQFTGTGGTVEVLARFGFGGLHVRSYGADLDRGLGVANLDARVLLGPQWLSLEAGQTRRALVGELASSQYTLTRVGMRSTFSLGGSGLRGMIGAWTLRGATLPTGVREASGLEGETALLYRLPRLPVFVQVGYRAESYAVTLSGNRSAPEELGVLTLGGGFTFGPAGRR